MEIKQCKTSVCELLSTIVTQSSAKSVAFYEYNFSHKRFQSFFFANGVMLPVVFCCLKKVPKRDSDSDLLFGFGWESI